MRVNIDRMIQEQILPLPDAEERLKDLINGGKDLAVLAIEYGFGESLKKLKKPYISYFIQYWKDGCAFWVDAELCEITDLYTPDDWVVSRSCFCGDLLSGQIGFIVGPESWNETHDIRGGIYSNLDTRSRTSKEWKLFKKTLKEYDRLSDENMKNFRTARRKLDEE